MSSKEVDASRGQARGYCRARKKVIQREGTPLHNKVQMQVSKGRILGQTVTIVNNRIDSTKAKVNFCFGRAMHTCLEYRRDRVCKEGVHPSHERPKSSS